MKKIYSAGSLIMLVIILLWGCTKTNNGTGWIPFINNDSVQFFRPPASIYNGPQPLFFTSIIIDKADTKWLQSNAGIFSFDGVNWVFYNSAGMLVDMTKYASSRLVCDSHGTIYLCLSPIFDSLGSKLILFKNGAWKSFQLPFPAFAMTIDKTNDNLYFQSYSGQLSTMTSIHKYNGVGGFSDLTSYSEMDLGGDYNILEFSVNHDSLLIFFDQVYTNFKTDSMHCGVFVQAGNGSRTIYNYPDSPNQLFLHGIFGNDGKTIIMTGRPQGWDMDAYDSLILVNGSGWSVIPFNPPGVYTWPNDLKYSNDGVLWISYGWSGLAKYEHPNFVFHDLSSSKPYSHIADFAFDSGNVKWLACWEGLCRYAIP